MTERPHHLVRCRVLPRTSRRARPRRRPLSLSSTGSPAPLGRYEGAADLKEALSGDPEDAPVAHVVNRELDQFLQIHPQLRDISAIDLRDSGFQKAQLRCEGVVTYARLGRKGHVSRRQDPHS